MWHLMFAFLCFFLLKYNFTPTNQDYAEWTLERAALGSSTCGKERTGPKASTQNSAIRGQTLLRCLGETEPTFTKRLFPELVPWPVSRTFNLPNRVGIVRERSDVEES